MNAQPHLPPGRVPAWLAACLVFCAVFLAFSPAITFEFINYDDPEFILENPNVNTGLSPANLRWALASPGEVNLWNPLSTLSHQLDVSLFGLNPAWHHATSVLWHALAATLLFLLARKLTGSTGWACFIALAWALHPQKIQSVAWVSERKDVLSGAIFLASVLCYAEWRSRTPRNPALYVSSLLLFIAAAMAKPSVLPLPLVLLALFHLGPRILSSLRQIGPFFLSALAMAGIVVFFKSQGTLGDVGSGDSPIGRAGQIVMSYAFYLVRFVLPIPSQLLFTPPASPLPPILCLAALVPFAAAVVWLGRREKLIPLGAAIYTILWLPVSGIIPVSHYFVADRYSYLPQIGIVLMLAGLARLLSTRLPEPAWQRPAAAAFLLCQLTVLQVQLPIWKDSRSLFAHEMSVNPASFIAPLHYGETFRRDDPGTALSHYRAAHLKQPDESLPLTKMGLMQVRLGLQDEALETFRKATEASNPLPEAWNQLLALQVERKLYEEAAETVHSAVGRFPDEWPVLMNGGNFHLLVRKDPAKALPLFLRAHEIAPRHPDSILAAARCHRLLGDGESAARLERLLPAR